MGETENSNDSLTEHPVMSFSCYAEDKIITCTVVFFVSMLSTFGSGGVDMFGSSHVQLTVCV